jgi:hypothetical protein
MMRNFEVHSLVSHFGQELKTLPSMSVSTIETTAIKSIEKSSRSYTLQAVANATLNVMLLQYAATTNQLVLYSTALQQAQRKLQRLLGSGFTIAGTS